MHIEGLILQIQMTSEVGMGWEQEWGMGIKNEWIHEGMNRLIKAEVSLVQASEDSKTWHKECNVVLASAHILKL